ALPAMQATRHPAIEKDFVIEYSSTAHSFAPSACRIDGGSYPSKPSSAYALSCTTMTSLARAKSTTRWKNGRLTHCDVGLCGNESTITRARGHDDSKRSHIASKNWSSVWLTPTGRS